MLNRISVDGKHLAWRIIRISVEDNGFIENNCDPVASISIRLRVIDSNLPFLDSGRDTHEGGNCTAILASCMFEDETLELRRKTGPWNVLIEGATLKHRKAGFRQRLLVLLDGESQTLYLRQNGSTCHWQCLIVRLWTRGGPCPFFYVQDVFHFREHN